MGARYVIECTWSGYHVGQRRVCHRMVIRNPERFARVSGILFTDGTTMSVSIRPCGPNERVQELDAYSSLLSEAAASGMTGYVSVAKLNKLGEAEA